MNMPIKRRREYLSNIASSFDKQIHFGTLIDELGWQFNLSNGQISFGEVHRWSIQLLGTESDDTWLWAWDNKSDDIPTHLLLTSFLMQTVGEQHGIAELTQPEVPLTQIDGHTLALIASGICQANAYYRCPYEGGALFVLIMDENFPKCQEPPLARIALVFPQMIANFEIPNHRLVFSSYLEYYGLAYEQEEDTITVNEGEEQVLTATFDEHNRLTNLEAKLKSDAIETDAVEKVETWEQAQLRRMLGG
jgi:hypothetical protein